MNLLYHGETAPARPLKAKEKPVLKKNGLDVMRKGFLKRREELLAERSGQ